MIVRAVTDWLVRQNAIVEDDSELYEYAIQSFAYSVTPIILLFAIGMVVGQTKSAIMLSIPLCLIRRYSGGYHAPYGWLCIIISVGVLSFCVLIQAYMQCNIWLLLFMLLAIFGLCILSPIDSLNRPLDQSEKKRYKKCTMMITLQYACAYLGAWLLGKEQVACCVATGIILAAFLQLPCIPKLLKDHLVGK